MSPSFKRLRLTTAPFCQVLSRGKKSPREKHVCLLSHFSCVRLFVTLWTVACQAPLSMEFSRQEYWSGQPFPSPGDLPDPGTGPTSAQLDSLLLGHLGSSKRGEGELQFSNPFCKGVVAMLLSHFSHDRLCDP